MKYILLLYREEQPIEATPELVAAYRTFLSEARPFGKRHGGHALRPSSEAKTVCLRGGKTVVTDGPFADTKEQLAGYNVYECDDLASAVRIAERLPWAALSRVEVRPIVEFGG
jgi:hypothetical protein